LVLSPVISSSSLAIPNNTVLQEHPDIEGTWLGTLHISSVELRIVFNVVKDSTGKLIATLDSPDQSAYDIPVDEVIFDGDSVKFIVKCLLVCSK